MTDVFGDLDRHHRDPRATPTHRGGGVAIQHAESNGERAAAAGGAARPFSGPWGTLTHRRAWLGLACARDPGCGGCASDLGDR
ncbi:hypothetical protein THAOC_23446, partial [Thalassiosira oceanica]